MNREHERFFGLHFDFHAGDDAVLGSRTEAEDIQRFLDAAKPDFIQCDSKGHRGFSSYPTEIGVPAPKQATDNMKIWSDVAKKNNVPLYVHHSGLKDLEYTKNYPEQAEVDRDGNMTDTASLFGEYAEKYLIPSLKEMIDKYDIDGVWMDGECWAVHRDYSELAKKHIPEDATDEERDEILKKAFNDYLRKCSEELHKHKPSFKYISNWAYSSYMPEKPEEGVLDSLSGDYPPTDSVYVARYEGRCLAAQNMPWDLMCWSFMREWLNPNFWSMKTEQQMEQEAAAVLMLGGGFQLYFSQNRDGSARCVDYAPLKGLSEFVHKRRMLFKKKTLAQVGIYYSATARYKNSEIYNAAGATEPLIGIINCTLSAQYTANVVLEYQHESLSEYDIVIVPEWEGISDEELKRLVEYAENGGKLVCAGPEISCRVGRMLGKSFKITETGLETEKTANGEIVPAKRYLLKSEDGGMEQLNGKFADIGCGEEMLYSNFDLRDEAFPAYRIEKCGDGAVAFVAFDLGANYFGLRSQKKARFLKRVLGKLSAPFIDINRTNIDVSVQENNDGIIVNLLNMYQNRYDVKFDVFDEVPPQVDIELDIKGGYCGVNMPLGEEFDYEIYDGGVKIKLKRLDIHSIIELKRA